MVTRIQLDGSGNEVAETETLNVAGPDQDEAPGINAVDVNAHNAALAEASRQIGNGHNSRQAEMELLTKRVEQYTAKSNAAMEAGDDESARRFALEANQAFQTIKDMVEIHSLQGDAPQETAGVTEEGLAQLRREAEKLDADGAFTTPDPFGS